MASVAEDPLLHFRMRGLTGEPRQHWSFCIKLVPPLRLVQMPQQQVSCCCTRTPAGHALWSPDSDGVSWPPCGGCLLAAGPSKLCHQGPGVQVRKQAPLVQQLIAAHG